MDMQQDKSYLLFHLSILLAPFNIVESRFGMANFLM